MRFKNPLNLKDSEAMPYLNQYFDTFKNKDVIIFVEIKSTRKHEIISNLKRIAQEYDIEDQIVIISFDENILAKIKNEWTGIPTGLLGTLSINSDASNNIASIAFKNWKLGTVPHIKYERGSQPALQLRRDATFRGMPFYTWTSRTAAEMDQQLADGYRGITTNASYLHGGYAVEVHQEDVTGSKVRLSPTVINHDRSLVTGPLTELVVISGKPPLKNTDGTFTPVDGSTKAMLRYTQYTGGGGYYYIYSNIFTIK